MSSVCTVDINNDTYCKWRSVMNNVGSVVMNSFFTDPMEQHFNIRRYRPHKHIPKQSTSDQARVQVQQMNQDCGQVTTINVGFDLKNM